MLEGVADSAGGRTQPAGVAPVVLPELEWVSTPACSTRGGQQVVRVVVHRWGVNFVDEAAEARDYHGVVDYFKNPAHQASAHIVFPGSAVPGHATQMVPWNMKAWAEVAYNPTSDDVESADAIWLGHDPHGMAVLARIVAKRLQARGLPPEWSSERGFCRHGDLGQLGGGHTACPTTDLNLWRAFVALVKHEHARGGFRAAWGC